MGPKLVDSDIVDAPECVNRSATELGHLLKDRESMGRLADRFSNELRSFFVIEELSFPPEAVRTVYNDNIARSILGLSERDFPVFVFRTPTDTIPHGLNNGFSIRDCVADNGYRHLNLREIGLLMTCSMLRK